MLLTNLLYKVNIVCPLIYFLTYLSYSSKMYVFPWSGRQKVLRTLFVSSKNARFIGCVVSRTCMNVHENLMQETCARNSCKFLAQVSWLCVTTISNIVNFRFRNMAYKARQARECRAAPSKILNIPTRHEEAPTNQKMSLWCPTFCGLWSTGGTLFVCGGAVRPPPPT